MRCRFSKAWTEGPGVGQTEGRLTVGVGVPGGSQREPAAGELLAAYLDCGEQLPAGPGAGRAPSSSLSLSPETAWLKRQR